ncbi:superoxide dismutase family protein [Duganella sp. CY15W]|uniref:superoxide dismutase family protein n=1 Tax=Duganella sp. CY15W TaxID=2692172 RepID=UPI00136F7875|nr:superoxide dismutase family protein [Duganella sp. CY15W]MYM28653.1 superoxide dismutase family protein [Duganella sp. CY15W]
MRVPSVFATSRLLALGLALAATGLAQAAATTAEAELKPTQGNNVSGTVRFAQQDGKLTIDADVKGLTPGVHGFHLHEKGDCSAPDGTSAGGHFNPGSQQHGDPAHAMHHGGDFGNLTADASGNAKLHLVVPTSQISLDAGAAGNVVGRGLIVHADADDFMTQPTGNSGKRLACGVVAAK